MTPPRQKPTDRSPQPGPARRPWRAPAVRTVATVAVIGSPLAVFSGLEPHPTDVGGALTGIAGAGLLAIAVAAVAVVCRRRRLSRKPGQVGAAGRGEVRSPALLGLAASADSGSGHTPGALVTPSVSIPEPVRALVQTTSAHPLPKANDDLRRLVDGLDPRTAPTVADLVDVVLWWIVTAPPDDPRLPAWADYARDASRRLHGDDHSRVRRAALAHAAVQTGLLTARAGDRDRCHQIEEVIRCVTDTSEPGGDETPTGRLTAYLTLHAYGHCDEAIAEVTRMLRTWPRDPFYPAGLPTIMVVLTAMLIACGRDRDARHFLDAYPGAVGATGDRLRDLFAFCAITITDIITAPHASVCTRDQPAYDRHAWSAMAHGEDPDRHLCVPPARRTPRPASGPAETTRPYDLFLSELPERIGYQHELRQNTAARRYPDSMHAAWTSLADLWLVCEDCHLGLLLGETTVFRAMPANPIGPVLIAGRPAWRSSRLGAAIWRLLHDHLGHRLRALTDTSPDWHTLMSTAIDVVDRPPAGISSATWLRYTDGWPQRPGLADYRGATPQPVIAEDKTEAYLSCASCGLDLVLGTCTIGPDTPQGPAVPAITTTDFDATVTAVMRLVTDHAGHDLRLLADEPQWHDNFGSHGWTDTIRANPDDVWDYGDATRAQYIAGWPEHTQLPRYRGFAPAHVAQPARHTRRTRPCCTPSVGEAADG